MLQPIVEEKNRKRCLSTPQELTPVTKRYKSASTALVPSPGVLQESNTPSRKQHTLFDYGFKRVGEPRPLLSHSLSLDETVTPPPRPKFRHCLSESEAIIKKALHRCKSSRCFLTNNASVSFKCDQVFLREFLVGQCSDLIKVCESVQLPYLL